MEVSIPRWISSAADGILDMTVGCLLPVAPPNHLAAVHVTSVRRSTTQAKWLPTAATGAGRFMLTYHLRLSAAAENPAAAAAPTQSGATQEDALLIILSARKSWTPASSR